jgi:hypothetical protein
MDAVVLKKCCVCGVDVSRMRRTRDPRGKYYCQPCYQTLWEAHQRRLREREAVEAEATAAALAMERAVEAAAAAAAEQLSAPEPAVMTAPVIDTLPTSPASPQFQISALPAAPEQSEPIQRAFSIGRALSRAATALASLRPASDPSDSAVVPVTAHRVTRHRSRHELRLSDLVGAEAQSAVEKSGTDYHEPEAPVSPITNPPVSALLDDYAALVEPREPVFRVPDASLA